MHTKTNSKKIIKYMILIETNKFLKLQEFIYISVYV